MTYSASDLPGRLIEWKTGAPTRSHVEIYIGGGMSFAARIQGVNYYPVRLDQYLMEVKRHIDWQHFDLVRAQQSVEDIIGKPYEIPGLLNYLDPWRKVHHLVKVCSTTGAHFMRAGGLEPFDADVPDDDITPHDFVVSGLVKRVWANQARLMVAYQRRKLLRFKNTQV